MGRTHVRVMLTFLATFPSSVVFEGSLIKFLSPGTISRRQCESKCGFGSEITQTQHQQRTTKMCKWWFTSVVSREDVLRRERGDLHQQGDADRDTGYSWGTGAVDDEGDRCLDSSYSLGSVKAGIGVTGTEVVILHLVIGAAKGQGGS